MKQWTKKKLDAMDALAATDPVYQEMMQTYRQMEKTFDQTVKQLTKEQHDLIWEYVMHCETMSRYLLELACIHMEFSAPQIEG